MTDPNPTGASTSAPIGADTSTTAKRRDRAHLAIGLVIVLVILGGGLFAATQAGVGPFAPKQNCRFGSGEHEVSTTFEQAENAAIIAAVGIRRQLPRKAVTIALATAWQESRLRNLDYGDRDSLGLFQQRPSKGWGTPAQVQDPYYASTAFYQALEKVRGWEEMDVTVAAQRVQRSAYPNAYAKHEDNSLQMSGALTGAVPHSVHCGYRPDDSAAGTEANVRSALTKAFGPVSGPAGAIAAPSRARAAQIAAFLAASCSKLQVKAIGFDGRQWRSGRPSKKGWTTTALGSATAGSSDVRYEL